MKVTRGQEETGVISKSRSKKSCESDLEQYLGSIRHSVPVASSQAKVTVAYPVQDLVGGVLRSIGKWSKTGWRKVDR